MKKTLFLTTGLAIFGLGLGMTAQMPLARADYTPGVLHEHVPDKDCLKLLYKDRHEPWMKKLRAELKRAGYKLYFDGHCWMLPAMAKRVRYNPCT